VEEKENAIKWQLTREKKDCVRIGIKKGNNLLII